MSKQHKKGKKASKRTVRCTMCTSYRWMGNNSGRFKAKDESKIKESDKILKNY